MTILTGPGVAVFQGDCLAILSAMPAESVHAVVTDPPYELAFMGKKWDGSGIAFNVDVWRECLRVLKPGGHLLAFGGSRTWHRLAVAIEDAGFEMRDSIAWLYGSGFPKSMDVSKAIDKHGASSGGAAELKRAIGVAVKASGKSRAQIDAECGFTMRFDVSYDRDPVGWGVSLPTAEQFDAIVAVVGEIPDWPRARLRGVWRGRSGAVESQNAAMSGGNYARTEKGVPVTPEATQWSGWGTALKPAFEPIVVARKPLAGTVAANILEYGTGALNIDGTRVGGDAGRWPTNVVLDGDAAEELDEQSGTLKSGAYRPGKRADGAVYGTYAGENPGHAASEGGASRFFPVFRYQAKAPAKERPKVDGIAHPTVKPLALMRWLVRLVTPAGGTVLDPFLGSGTTAQAARDEGFVCLGIERESDYMRLIAQRLGLELPVTADEETAA